MIQMRENRYDDIRNGVVNRSSEAPKMAASQDSKNVKKTSNDKSNDLDPRANRPDEYLDDEYNSWS